MVIDVPVIDNAKIMSKGQVTIPKEIRGYLNVAEGDSPVSGAYRPFNINIHDALIG